jgi:hypothetical protein
LEQPVKVFSVAILCVLLGLSGTAQATIMIFSQKILALANDGSGEQSQRFDGNLFTPLPINKTLTAVSGSNQNKTTINESTSGGQTILSLDVDHQRTGAVKSFADTICTVSFKAISDQPYTISGFYNATDVGPTESGQVGVEWSLYEGTDVYSFLNEQFSESTHDEHFVLGQTGGDSTNVLIGSSTGNLIAGHFYTFFADITVFAPNADSGVGALGNVTLTIGAIPEPSSELLLLAGICAGQLRRDRRRSLGC